MSDSISYTPEELAKLLKISRFTVYELIKRGELTAYHIGRKVRVEASDLEKYKQKSKGLTADTSDAPASAKQPLQDSLIICGQDNVLDVLTRNMSKKLPSVSFLRHNVGSIDGLTALYRGAVHVCTAHLWDGDTGDYNTPYVRHLVPGQRLTIFNLMYRTAGFYVAKGNPKNILSWSDLPKPAIQLVNRERGSGARVLLDEHLRCLNIDYRSIKGYQNEELSHLAVASTVARGDADVGVGIEKVALQVQNIDFVPLQTERYDMVIKKEDLDNPIFQMLIATVRSANFKDELNGMGGYDISRTGEIMAEI